jgi:pilus assembly protein CpaF
VTAASSSPAAVAARVHARLLAGGADATGALAERVARLVAAEAPLLPPAEAHRLVRDVVAHVGGLGPLEPLLTDPAVTDVMVSAGRVWVERDGAVEDAGVRLSATQVASIIERVVAPLGLRVDRASPLVDARLPDGSRVHAVVAPLAVDGPCLTIRRFGARALPLDAFCPPPVASLLADAVRARMNVLVSGGTGAGKTTLLNALGSVVPVHERVITIEDAAELRLPGDHVVRLEARPANAEGAGEVRIRELVRNALRMRPDRIVVGECRGAEALDMLQAMNTGHEGSLSTCHANSPDDAVRRIETMVLMAEVALPLAAVREQLASSLDLVVQIARRPGGQRRVVAVAEVSPTPGGDGRVTTRLLADETAMVARPARPSRAADVAWPS